jgi:hypothetical protein
VGAALGDPRRRASIACVMVALLHAVALIAAAIGVIVADAWLRRP